jgi:GNAT superfamily N-acetyltransferase
MTDPIEHARDRGSPVRLKDGTLCYVRAIGCDDRGFVQSCFARLSPASRRRRFFGAKQALTESDLADLTSADGRDHIAFGAVRRDANGEENESLGAARCIRLSSGSETAELALAVVDRSQGQGVGTALLNRLIQAARAQGIRRFRCEVMVENEPMRALAQRLGGQVRWLDNGIMELDCELPDPAPVGAEPDPAETSPWWDLRPAADAWADALDRVLASSLALFGALALSCYDSVSPSPLER